jgi:hypothetical protein
MINYGFVYAYGWDSDNPFMVFATKKGSDSYSGFCTSSGTGVLTTGPSGYDRYVASGKGAGYDEDEDAQWGICFGQRVSDYFTGTTYWISLDYGSNRFIYVPSNVKDVIDVVEAE